jgi:hypothetical protein
VSYFVGLPLPLTAVEAALTRSPEAWVPALARAADAHGERLLAEVGFRLGGDGEGPQIAKRVGTERGQHVRSPARTWLPLAWRAPGPESCSPASTANSRSCRSGPAPNPGSAPNTSLRSAPIGPVDRALLYRVAEAAVKELYRLRGRRPDTARGQRPIRA